MKTNINTAKMIAVLAAFGSLGHGTFAAGSSTGYEIVRDIFPLPGTAVVLYNSQLGA